MRRPIPPARLLIVEDHPLYRDGVLALLAREAPELRCHTVAHAAEALARLQAHPEVDLVLSDLKLPGPMDGLGLLAEVALSCPTAARVLISGTDDPALPQQCRRMGLMGYLPKSLPPLRWIDGLVHILQGDPWFPAGAAEAAAEPSARQLQILDHLARGQSNRSIGEALAITERTVKYHLQEIYHRLGAANRAEAVARAAARGWIRLPARP